MPKVKEQGIAKYCDVFCEADTFTTEESRQVLEAGLKYGLRPKIHADEIEAIGRQPRLMTNWRFRQGQEPGLKSVAMATGTPASTMSRAGAKTAPR